MLRSADTAQTIRPLTDAMADQLNDRAARRCLGAGLDAAGRAAGSDSRSPQSPGFPFRQARARSTKSPTSARISARAMGADPTDFTVFVTHLVDAHDAHRAATAAVLGQRERPVNAAMLGRAIDASAIRFIRWRRRRAISRRFLPS